MTSQVDTYRAELRSVLGKRVKRLRREGILPANVYGRGQPSLAVQLPERAARDMLIAHGMDTLIQLHVEGEAAPRPVVVRDVQRHVLSRVVQHIDFWQVDLTRTIEARVPVHIVGEAPAVHIHQGVLIHETDTVIVRALPAEIPDAIEVSVEGLEELESQVMAGEIVLPEGVEMLIDPTLSIVRVARPRLIVEEEVAEGEEALVEGEAPEGESAEGESEETANQ